MQSDSFRDQELFESDGERRARARERTWQTLGTLYRWRRFIAGVTAAVAVAAVVITLLMSNVYRASAHVLLPASQGGLSAQLLSNLPSAASALLGGAGGGDYVRYMAILNSRGVQEAAVDSFDLVRVYELEESDTPREDAMELFADNAEFEFDEEFEFLNISVLDVDPERAARMANFLVRQLNERNVQIATQSARSYREFMEVRYHEARAAVDSVLTATERFQSTYGIFDLPAQTQAFFEYIAQLRAEALQAEVQYAVMLEQYGSDNPRVEAARQVVRAADAQYRQALAGGEQILPVPQKSVPAAVRRYSELEMERTIQAAILEVIGPMYEQARLQEQKDVIAVEVLDRAVPPVKKAAPRRSLICIAATISAFLLASLFALLMSWWRRNHVVFAGRLQRAAVEADREQHVTSP